MKLKFSFWLASFWFRCEWQCLLGLFHLFLGMVRKWSNKVPAKKFHSQCGPHVSFLCLLSSDQVVDLAAAHESDRQLNLFSLYHATVSVCVCLCVGPTHHDALWSHQMAAVFFNCILSVCFYLCRDCVPIWGLGWHAGPGWLLGLQRSGKSVGVHLQRHRKRGDNPQVI